MRDGSTRKLTKASGPELEAFFSRFRATIVILSGDAAGSEYELNRTRVTMGRGPDVDLAFDDPSMSRQHAVLELVSEGFRIRDLKSTNGVLVDGMPYEVMRLKHGDRFQLGEHSFQYLVEERERGPREYRIPEQ